MSNAIAAPDDVYVGTVTDVGREDLKVYRTPGGNILVLGNMGTILMFRPGGVAAFFDLLSRAGVTDQVLACRCSIAGSGEVIPPACPVHGVPCEDCGGVEECSPDCGDGTGVLT